MFSAVYTSRVLPGTTLLSTSLSGCGKQASKQTHILPIPIPANKKITHRDLREKGKQTLNSCFYTCGWLSSGAEESQKSKADHPEYRKLPWETKLETRV